MSVVWTKGHRCQARVSGRWVNAFVVDASEDCLGPLSVRPCTDRGSTVMVGRSDVRFHSSRSELNIFDFDGTLFRSPVPQPLFWASDAQDLLMRSRERGGLGWFEHPYSLGDSFGIALGDPSMFNSSVVEAARSSWRTGGRTVLLTGRGMLAAPRVRELLDGGSLSFHEYVYKTNTSLKTSAHKLAALRDLLNAHPQLTRVNIWEDQSYLAAEITKELQEHKRRGRLLSYNVFNVVGGSSHLSADAEMRLFELLMSMSPSKYTLSPRVERTILRLDDASLAAVRALAETYAPPGWARPSDHELVLAISRLHAARGSVGDARGLTVDAVGEGRRTVVARVVGCSDWPWSDHSVPHILLAHAPFANASGRAARTITRWVELEAPVSVSGTVAHVNLNTLLGKGEKDSSNEEPL